MSNETKTEHAPIRHVVAATDFSEPAAVGVAWVRDVARAHGATLHLVQAVYPIEPGLVGLVPPLRPHRASDEERPRAP